MTWDRQRILRETLDFAARLGFDTARMAGLLERFPELTPRDAFILVMRESNPGGKPPSYASIGQHMAISYERARTLYKDALRKTAARDGGGHAADGPC